MSHSRARCSTIVIQDRPILGVSLVQRRIKTKRPVAVDSGEWGVPHHPSTIKHDEFVTANQVDWLGTYSSMGLAPPSRGRAAVGTLLQQQQQQ